MEMVRVQVAEAAGPVLNWLTAKALGMALRESVAGTDVEAATRVVPFKMFEVLTTHVGHQRSSKVEEVTITRFGITPGCSLPSIDFTDSRGAKARGSIDLFFFSKEEAELECLGVDKGFAGPHFSPSTDWAQAGPILEGIRGSLFKHWLESNREGRWQAEIHNEEGDWIAFGLTELVARLRCFVAWKLGDEVEVPAHLVDPADVSQSPKASPQHPRMRG